MSKLTPFDSADITWLLRCTFDQQTRTWSRFNCMFSCSDKLKFEDSFLRVIALEREWKSDDDQLSNLIGKLFTFQFKFYEYDSFIMRQLTHTAHNKKKVRFLVNNFLILTHETLSLQGTRFSLTGGFLFKRKRNFAPQFRARCCD